MTILALGLALAAQAQAPPPSAQLEPLAFFVGSCWRATVQEGRATDTHCFTPVFGGRFVRDRHALAPLSYSGETLYRWDATARQIRFDYYSSEGLLISGTAAAVENRLRFELGYVSREGTPIAMRAAWTRDGPDAYVVVTEVREGDGWRPTGRTRFARVSPAPAD